MNYLKIPILRQIVVEKLGGYDNFLDKFPLVRGHEEVLRPVGHSENYSSSNLLIMLELENHYYFINPF